VEADRHDDAAEGVGLVGGVQEDGLVGAVKFIWTTGPSTRREGERRVLEDGGGQE
jgi:hypothetical protein